MQSEPESEPAETERRKRHTATGLAVFALGLAAVGFAWLATSGEAPAEATAAGLAPIAVPGPTSFAELEQRVEPEPPVVASVPAADEIELCGGHWVAVGPDGKPAPEALQAIVASLLDEVAGDALGLMAGSPSPRVRAAAHYFRVGRFASADVAPGDGRLAAAAHRDALARLASTTDDVHVYAWAWRACKGAPEGAPGACMQVGAAQWARLDPDNAEAWLAVAEEARRHKDEAALDDAMFHVAAAERHDPGRMALAAALADYTPHDERSLIGTALAIAQAVRIDAAGSADWQGVAEYCSAGATAEANRRETCDRVAGVLAERSTSVAARDVAVTLGRRLGWSEERLEALAREREAEPAAARASGGGPDRFDPMACAAMHASIERVRAEAEFGEIEALRRGVAGAGRSLARR